MFCFEHVELPIERIFKLRLFTKLRSLKLRRAWKVSRFGGVWLYDGRKVTEQGQ